MRKKKPVKESKRAMKEVIIAHDVPRSLKEVILVFYCSENMRVNMKVVLPMAQGKEKFVIAASGGSLPKVKAIK